jgi:hypothetical protein
VLIDPKIRDSKVVKICHHMMNMMFCRQKNRHHINHEILWNRQKNKRVLDPYTQRFKNDIRIHTSAHTSTHEPRKAGAIVLTSHTHTHTN